jgi:hypothetical protein
MHICSPKEHVRNSTTPKSNGVSGSTRSQHVLQLVVGDEGASGAVDVDAEPSEYLLLGGLRVVVMAGIGIFTLSGLIVRGEQAHSCCKNIP